MLKWLNALTSDPQGKPDEARVAFLLGVLTIIGLKTYATICPDHPFNSMDFSTGFGGLLAFYNASQGRMGTFGRGDGK